jgi:hypothetical protein
MKDVVTVTETEPTPRRLDETVRTAIAQMDLRDYVVIGYRRSEPLTVDGVWSAELRFPRRGEPRR